MRRVLVTILVALAMVGTAACGGEQAASAPEASPTAAEKPETPKGPLPVNDGMEPAQPVQVGEFRFTDACQALDAAAVTKIFGRWGPRGSFRGQSRTALPEVESREANGANSDCYYNLEDKHNQRVEVGLDQYTTETAAREAWLSDLDIANGALRKKLDALQKKLGKQAGGEAGKAKDAEQMLEGMRGELKALEKEREGLTMLDAGGRPVIFMPSRSKFFSVHGNVVVELTYTFGPPGIYDPGRKISRGELPAAMRKIRRSLKTIDRSLTDPSLSQAPASSIPSGAKTLGETRLLEPCALLTPGIFVEVVGADPYPDVSAESGPWNPRRMIKSNYSSPTCERHIDEEVAEEVAGTMMVTLHHTVSDAAATAKLESLCTPSSRNLLKPLEIPGVVGPVRCLDRANASSDSGAFRSGPYVVELNMYDGYLRETSWFPDDTWELAFELLNERLQEFV